MKTYFQVIESILDLYIELDCPPLNYVYQDLVEEVDFDTAEACRGHLSTLCDTMKEVERISTHMQSLAAELRDKFSDPEPREEAVYESYGKTNQARMVIDLINGGELSKDQLKILIYQTIA